MVGFSGLFHDGVVTDGHDSGVFNNRVNAELNGRGRARKLLWDEGEKGRKEVRFVTQAKKRPKRTGLTNERLTLPPPPPSVFVSW